MLVRPLAITALAFAAPAPAPAPATSPAAPHVEPGEREPNSDDRAAAATTSGIGAFVGTALGGVLVPGVAGLIGNALGVGRLSSADLLILSTVGGTTGAAVGGGFGAVFTTRPFLGPALVGVAGAAGAAAGLVPSIFIGKIKPATLDPNDPVKLAQSACILASLVASSAAAAGTGALLATPAPPPEVRK